MKEEKREFPEKSILFVQKYFFWAIVLVLVILSFLIIRSFIIALISAFILAYLGKPLQKKLSKHINRKISALICLLIIISAILIPVFFLIYSLISQIRTSLNTALNLKLNIPFLEQYVPSIKETALNILLDTIKTSLSHLPSIILSLFITLIATYYILSDWERITKKVEIIMPFKDKSRIRNEVSILTNNIVYGYLFIAIIEFIIAFLGFYLSGVKLFLLLPALIALFAFIPGLGPAVIWIPTSLYYFATQNYPTAIGVLITGLIISLIIETILLPKIVGGKSNIHPLIFLLGVLGGVPIFGIFGFIMGPLILVYTIKLIEESLHNS
jgi:predicted PurR-regulated permease PerM